MIWGHLLRHGVGCSTIRYGAWAHSLTHVFMYSHFLWRSFGLKNSFKRYITLWQICQPWSCLAHAVLVCALETTRISHFSWLQVAYQMTMVYFFTFKLSWAPSWTPAFGQANAGKKEKKAA